ncbi:low molecular weight protein-tyrosine-phosphatase [Pedobacter alpinus]|uniref:protein-tyrosine-phosphatase n=1 Tax=Pedobacter alpinus TaxID=1590643 RepID=A0ABW5TNS3_9SPHI
MKILMVCLGNICRSPLAHGVMEHLVKQEGLNWEIESAGTGGYHIGAKPDHRSIKIAKLNGIDISGQQARKFNVNDFDAFDYIFVMDKQNYKDVIALAKNEEQKNKVKLFLDDDNVPDPYYDDELFEPVSQMITTQCAKLLKQLKS